MWTVEQRQTHDRAGLRYPSDLTDAEWALVEPFIPPARRGGRKRTVDVREVLNGIFYVLATGCQWRALPKDLPPSSTVHDYLALWARDGTLGRLHHALFVRVRERAGKEASPTAAIIDSQSVKGAEEIPCGWVAARLGRSRPPQASMEACRCRPITPRPRRRSPSGRVTPPSSRPSSSARRAGS